MKWIIILAAIIFYNGACVKRDNVSTSGQGKPEMKITEGGFSEPEMNNNTVVVRDRGLLGPFYVYAVALLICLVCFACGWAISMCTYTTLFSSAVEEGMKDTFEKKE